MSKIKEENLKTAKKWQKEFEAEFEYDIHNSKVCSLGCITSKLWESQMKSLENFISKWLSPGATSIDKSYINQQGLCKKTCLSLQHQEAVKLPEKSKLGSEAYKQLVVEKTLIGQSLKCMCGSDCKSLRVKFNCAYYLAKLERPYSDYLILLSLHEKNRVKV